MTDEDLRRKLEIEEEAKLKSMAELERIVHAVDEHMTGPYEEIKDRVKSVEDDVQTLAESHRELAKGMEKISGAVAYNSDRLNKVFEATSETNEINGQILAVVEKFQAFGTVASVIGGVIPWLLKTNTGRGFAIIVALFVMGFNKELALSLFEKFEILK